MARWWRASQSRKVAQGGTTASLTVAVKTDSPDRGADAPPMAPTAPPPLREKSHDERRQRRRSVREIGVKHFEEAGSFLWEGAVRCGGAL